MLTVHNFLPTPAGHSALDVFSEAHAYGPGTSGFHPDLALDVTEAVQPATVLRVMVDGFLRVEGVVDGFDANDVTAPLRLLLTPGPAASLPLHLVTAEAGLMAPVGFRYVGVDQIALEARLGDAVRAMDADPEIAITEDEKWQAFRDGVLELKVETGQELGLVAEDGDSGGAHRLRFQVVVRNGHLDPVALFTTLAAATDDIELVDGDDSWLEVVDRSRILVSLRDEWDAPLTEGQAIVTTDQDTVNFTLSDANKGTFALTAAQGEFVLEVGARSLTSLPDPDDDGASDTKPFDLTPPTHVTLGSVNGDDWFAAQHLSLAPFRYTEGNDVEILIDGKDNYRALVADLRAISNASHFAFFSNWWMDVDFELLPGDPRSTLRVIANDIDAQGAKTRALVWDQWIMTAGFAPVNVTAFNLFRNLPNGAAILDRRTHHSLITSDAISLSADVDLYDPFEIFSFFEGSVFHVGAHHWKCTVIRNAQSPVAYLGGIDINTNRLDSQDHDAASPYHDVHCRIRGPAVHDAAKAFIDRWNDHPDRGGDLDSPGQLLGGPPPAAGTCMVQIARTFGAGTQSYAPAGDRTIWATLERAIGRARKYIYIEDQYLSYEALSEALEDALDRIDHLIIVVDGTGGSRWDDLRNIFLHPLHAKAQHKLHVFQLALNGEPFKVHTKSVIIDDIFATIGSANMGRRSMTHDSEINAFMLDGAIRNGSRKFARDLRIALWGEHLGWQNQPDRAEADLGDIDQAIDVFLNRRPATARIQSYDVTPGILRSPPVLSDELEDPDGTFAPT